MTCGLCDECACSTASKEQREILYEIHITVENDKNFIETCEELGCKSIIIGFGNDVAEQVMATKVLKIADFKQVQTESITLAGQFLVRNWHVKRVKIETVLWNPLARDVRHGQYFEVHFACVPFFTDYDLEYFFKKFELHKSKNLLKKGEKQYQMLTYRSKEDLHNFEKSVLCTKIFLTHYLNIEIMKTIKEFCVFDTNIELDNDWLNSM